MGRKTQSPETNPRSVFNMLSIWLPCNNRRLKKILSCRTASLTQLISNFHLLRFAGILFGGRSRWVYVEQIWSANRYDLLSKFTTLSSSFEKGVKKNRFLPFVISFLMNLTVEGINKTTLSLKNRSKFLYRKWSIKCQNRNCTSLEYEKAWCAPHPHPK